MCRTRGETGIAGATVQLYRTSDNALVGTTSTDANGAYQFAALDPGSYYILEPQPAGFLDGIATPGLIGGAPCATCTVSGTYNPANEAASISRINGVDVSVGDSATVMNFGELVPSTLTGSVFVDFNTNGLRNVGEPGIATVALTLTGTDDRGNAVSRPVTTDASGNYTMGSLRPSNAGGYTITETQPAGFNNGPNPPLGGADSLGGTRAASGPTFGIVISAIPVAPNQNGINYTFGELGGTTVSGLVFIDRNRDGVLQPIETGRIAGVTIQLIDPVTSAVIATTTTDATGNYVFTGAPVGNYRIFEVQPAGFGSSTPDTLNVTIPVAGLTNQNFGDTASSVAGMVFIDLNNNGSQQLGEPPIAGNPIELLDAATSTVLASTTTDAAGAWRFDDLRSANYSVRQPTQPPGTTNGITTAGTAGGTATAVTTLPSAITNFALPIAIDATAYRFAEIQFSSLAGSVYNDVNNNGVRDPAISASPARRSSCPAPTISGSRSTSRSRPTPTATTCSRTCGRAPTRSRNPTRRRERSTASRQPAARAALPPRRRSCPRRSRRSPSARVSRAPVTTSAKSLPHRSPAASTTTSTTTACAIRVKQGSRHRPSISPAPTISASRSPRARSPTPAATTRSPVCDPAPIR